MSRIVNQSGRPMEKELEKKEAPKNGANKQEHGMLDIRTVPTGTLIYNLILATQDERGAGMAIHQMEMMKAQQKMVADPPQLENAKAAFVNHEQRRFALANEINIRFKASDESRVADLGMVLATFEDLAAKKAEQDADG